MSQINYVNVLSSVCTQCLMPPPEYSIIRKGNERGRRWFIMRCVAFGSSFSSGKVIGTRSEAESVAAERAIDCLNCVEVVLGPIPASLGLDLDGKSSCSVNNNNSDIVGNNNSTTIGPVTIDFGKHKMSLKDLIASGLIKPGVVVLLQDTATELNWGGVFLISSSDGITHVSLLPKWEPCVNKAIWRLFMTCESYDYNPAFLLFDQLLDCDSDSFKRLIDIGKKTIIAKRAVKDFGKAIPFPEVNSFASAPGLGFHLHWALFSRAMTSQERAFWYAGFEFTHSALPFEINTAAVPTVSYKGWSRFQFGISGVYTRNAKTLSLPFGLVLPSGKLDEYPYCLGKTSGEIKDVLDGVGFMTFDSFYDADVHGCGTVFCVPFFGALIEYNYVTSDNRHILNSHRVTDERAMNDFAAKLSSIAFQLTN